MLKFIIYLFRWQLSTPILAPVLLYLTPMLLAYCGDQGAFWTATVIANFVGAFLFFWIDRYIFSAKSCKPDGKS
ncbi:MAG: hypothetical protein LBH00_00845 [Planctomycetaceae bacterium]|jgi:hypothetical protein|nr:hypothetical protein [Planctomycetaceae bacterium]